MKKLFIALGLMGVVAFGGIATCNRSYAMVRAEEEVGEVVETEEEQEITDKEVENKVVDTVSQWSQDIANILSTPFSICGITLTGSAIILFCLKGLFSGDKKKMMLFLARVDDLKSQLDKKEKSIVLIEEKIRALLEMLEIEVEATKNLQLKAKLEALIEKYEKEYGEIKAEVEAKAEEVKPTLDEIVEESKSVLPTE